MTPFALRPQTLPSRGPRSGKSASTVTSLGGGTLAYEALETWEKLPETVS